MKTQINLKLKDDILEKLDKKAKEEHRTRTNLIEKMIIDYLGTRNYWLWVNSGEMDIGDSLEEGYKGTWQGCDPRTSKGDKILIYRVIPHKHIKYLVEVLEDAEEDEIETDKGEMLGFKSRFKILYNFEEPLKIENMKDYPSLSQWYPLKVRFVRMVFKIGEKYWETLRDILITKNRNSKNYF